MFVEVAKAKVELTFKVEKETFSAQLETSKVEPTTTKVEVVEEKRKVYMRSWGGGGDKNSIRGEYFCQ